MPRGYEEGPIAEEVERRLDELRRGVPDVAPTAERAAVFGVTGDDPTSHFIGWLGEVDPEALFESGEAWGLTVRRVAETPT
jgi:hypothetical protein